MARVLIVGCGCRGGALARDLVAAGHAVRGTTRDPARAPAIAAAGAEPYVGDPDRIGTLMDALAGVTIVCWLMGAASGDPAGRRTARRRLRMLFEARRHARGVFVHGSRPAPELLANGRAVALLRSDLAHPAELVEADPGDHERWLPPPARRSPAARRRLATTTTGMYLTRSRSGSRRWR